MTPLERLARDAGIAVTWRDADGRPAHVPPDRLRAILAALDYPATNAAQIRDSRSRLRHALATPRLQVVTVNQSFAAPGRALHLTSEDGRACTLPVRSGQARATLLPGYYRLDDGRGLAVTPPRAFQFRKPAWGVAAQLYSLRGSPGFGDFGALAQLVEQTARVGGDAVMLSPVHALPKGGVSPYTPTSRQFLNPLYIPLAGGDDGNMLIDWQASERQRLAALRRDYSRFQGDTEFDRFVKEGGTRLKRHARFMEADAPGFALWLQWRADSELARVQAGTKTAGMRIGLISDIAVGVDPKGSEAHGNDQMLQGLTIGAPPDAFNADGQGWGLTSFSPAGLIASGYDGYLQMLRAAMRHAGGIRLDHAMGLTRLWVIPQGAPPTEGAYLHYPLEDLLGLLCLESQRHGAVVIAEDLGTVQPAFRRRIEQAGLMGMDVLWFTRKGAQFIPPADWSADRVALTTTHDLPTLAGWWSGHDLTWLDRIHGKDAKRQTQRQKDRKALWRALKAGGAKGAMPDAPDTFIDGALTALAAAPSRLKLIALEDFTGATEQPNIPGTIDEHPNWRRRLKAKNPFAAAAAKRRAALLGQP